MKARNKKSKIYRLARSLKPLGKSLARKSHSELVKHCHEDKKMMEKILCLLVKKIQNEMSSMCSFQVNSILRKKLPEDLTTFEWEKFTSELEEYSPSLLKILRGCILKQKRPEKVSRQPKYNENAIVGICAAILLRYRNQRLNLIQRIVSILLYCGHAPKSVSYCEICEQLTTNFFSVAL